MPRSARFRVETLKQATGRFAPYQTYDDRAAADGVAEQLRWVGATVRVVRA